MGRRRLPSWVHEIRDLKEALDIDWGSLAGRLGVDRKTLERYRKNWTVANVPFLLRLKRMEEEHAERLALYAECRRKGNGARPSPAEARALMRSVEFGREMDRDSGVDSSNRQDRPEASRFLGSDTPGSVGVALEGRHSKVDYPDPESRQSTPALSRAGWTRGWIVTPQRKEARVASKTSRLKGWL